MAQSTSMREGVVMPGFSWCVFGSLRIGRYLFYDHCHMDGEGWGSGRKQKLAFG